MQTPHINIIPLRSAVSSDHSTELDILVKITPPELEPEEKTKRPSLNIGLVIDRSGSMQGQKIEYARQAACYAIEQLLPTDRVSVTIYDDEVTTLIASTLATNKANIIHKIKQIQPRNMTALHAGWAEGAAQVSQYLNPELLNRVILLSDGLANQGQTDPNIIAADVRHLAKSGVSTTTIGIGDDYNEDLMAAMAVSGDGNYYYIQSSQQLPNIFGRELQGLMATMGTKVTLGIEPQGEITLIEILNDLEVNKKGRYRLPNLVTGNPIKVVVRLKIPPLQQETELCSFRIAWKNPKQPKRQKIKVPLRLPAVSATELENLPIHLEVQQEVALLISARAKKEATRLVDQGDYVAAQELLKQTKEDMSEQFESQLLSEVEALSDLEEELKARNFILYRKMSTYHHLSHSRSSREYELFYRLRKGPKSGDITQVNVEAIVNSSDTRLSNLGTLSNAIHHAAGPQLLEACQQLNGCSEGEAKITPGFNLRARWVIHTVCPPWQGGHHDEERLLAQCYQRCLELATQHHIRTIAFPAIGTGNNQFPIERAAQIAIREIIRFLVQDRSIATVDLVCFDDETLKYFSNEFLKVTGW